MICKFYKFLAIANLMIFAPLNASECNTAEKSLTCSQFIKIYIPKDVPVKELSTGEDKIYHASKTGIISIPNSEYKYITIPQVNKQFTKYSPEKKIYYPFRHPLQSDHIGGWLRGDGDYVLTPIPDSNHLVLKIFQDERTRVCKGFSLIQDYAPLTLQQIALRTFKHNQSQYILNDDIINSLPEEISKLIKDYNFD